MKSVMVWNRKGGVGKTTLATHLAWLFGEAGKRVLLIDLDSQGNASDALVESNVIGDSADMFRTGVDLSAIFKPGTEGAGISLLRGTEALANVERESLDIVAQAFRRSYDYLSPQFDAAVLDGPPAQTVALLAALMRVNSGVAPIELSQWSVSGVETMLRTYVGVRKKFNPQLDFIGMLPCRVDNRLASNAPTLQALSERYGQYLLPLQLSQRSAVRQVAVTRRPVWSDRSTSGAAAEMILVCKTIATRVLHAS